jgi:hypothetical protein
MPKFRTISESLNYIMTGAMETAPGAIQTETFEDRVTRARKVIADDATFLDFIKMATDPDYKISGLKEGMPSKVKLERTIPAGISDSTARQEYRRIKGFLPKGSYENLKPVKREEIWTTLLEGIHWSEAVALTQIKDQTLMAEYAGLEPVLLAAQGKDIVVETTIAPTELVKEALKIKIDIDTGVATNKAAKAGVDAFDNRPTASSNPTWLPAATNGVPLLEVSLTTKAPETTEAPKKKRTRSPNKAKKTENSNAEATVETHIIPSPVPDDPSVLTKAEYDEMTALSDTLREERNVKMNAMQTQEEIMKFIPEWDTYSTEKLKALRNTQLANRNKEQ